jgi:hypothetical protein
MKIHRLLPLLSLLPSLLPHGAAAATRYDGDGTLSNRQELIRWYINRARFAPEREADRLGLTNSLPQGHPGYDVCEDSDPPNDFGATTNEWAFWIAPLPPLAPNALLTAAAQKHAQDMAESGIFQHESPTSNYYPIGSEPWDRGLDEGYDYWTYSENIGGGFTSPSNLHALLFIDEGIENRGHRMAILDPDSREIGLGYAKLASSTHYDVHDYAMPFSNVFFFTDTVFCDGNTNGLYNEGEGVAGIEVRLWNGTNEAPWYDMSQASGSFAIPIESLPAGKAIRVELRNASGSNRVVTLPLGFNTLGEIALTNGQSFAWGEFAQPAAPTNIGFRNSAPGVSTTIARDGAGVAIAFLTLGRVAYRVDGLDAPATNWIAWTNVTATGMTMRVTDPAPATHRWYRVSALVD